MVESINPAWLMAAIDQRIAKVDEALGSNIPEAIVMTMLTEPEGDNSERWERTCDNCGTFVPEGTEFFTGTVSGKLRTGMPIVITFGSCRACKDV